MKRILVSGASGIVGYGVLRSLRQSESELFLLGTSIYEDSVAPAFCDVFEQAPATDEEGYLNWLVTMIRSHRIDLLIPGIEIDVFKWGEHEKDIRSAGSIPLLNTPELLDLCKDKWLFYKRLKYHDLCCAIDSSLNQDFANLESKFSLPFILKPRRGFGSKGIVRITGPDVFFEHVHDLGHKLMAQPIVGHDAEEFTTSAFCDGQGSYYTAMTLRRTLSREGFTEKAEVVDTSDFDPTIAKLCKIFSPLGPTNFQFRMCSDGPKLLEINPRISSSTSIRTAFGYNESIMAVDYFLDQLKPVHPLIKRGRAVRYTDEQIFYEDSVYL